ncbi:MULTISPECIES: glycosyltransferase family 2 protein [unclassified Sphingomonas]|uniref:glycosyltransferase family 2 protein n=1 Tax=unclassified Sphingomonas TaxID=196159 RepID=UPI000A8ADED0
MTTGVGAPLTLAVVVPVFNERGNVARMVDRLAAVLGPDGWEAIFVDDDSPDGTAGAARELARVDPRVRVIQRIGRRGLATACIEGMCATAAPLVAVIDGDLQHDEALLPQMRDLLNADPALDLVIGSRFMPGGGTGDWDRDRVAKSRLATRLARAVLKAELTDPMSGFFMIRSAVVRALVPRLSGIGFKILLDILTSAAQPLRFVELPYVFRARVEGESKLDHVVALEYLIALYDRLLGWLVPVRFAMFASVGAMGAAVHLGVLSLLLAVSDARFLTAQIAATLTAMTFNFLLNNALTYRDKRLRGARALIGGWLSFCTVCAVGAVANVGVAEFLYTARQGNWALSALAGIAVAAVWNFAVSSRFTWGRYGRRRSV